MSSRYRCQSCGATATKWAGKCAGCETWNSLVEELRPDPPPHARGGRREPVAPTAGANPPQRLAAVTSPAAPRLSTGLAELDRALGEGMVRDSLILLGGEPGVGKSTLLLQMMAHLSRTQGPVLYVSGEESLQQIKLRSDRLGLATEELFLLAEVNLARVLAEAERLQPAALVIDSVQTCYLPEFSAGPGTITQVRECATRCLLTGKEWGIPVWLVGHITKDGAIAGPKALEHIVDTVLYFETDRQAASRIIRAVKNRYGPTNEIALFEMRQAGLVEVANASQFFLAQRVAGGTGSVVVPGLEGSRPVLVEVQALVSGTAPGSPRRMGMGFDHHRVSLLAAVIEKRMGVRLGAADIFVNVAGGLRFHEPAMDLGVALAILSSFHDRPVDPAVAVFGEVGLTGEIRGVDQVPLRLQEAASLGFERCLIPKSNLPEADERIQVQGVSHMQEAYAALC